MLFSTLLLLAQSFAPQANVIYREVPHPMGPTPNAAFGVSVVTLDYQGDQELDLAVGAPGEEAVYILFGPDLTSWIRLEAPNPQTGADFGSDLAVGQIDTTAGDELVVGAPNTDVAGVSKAGKVFVFGRGIPNPIEIEPSNPVDNAGFGNSVEVGDFDNTSGVEVAVGTSRDLVQNAPAGKTYIFSVSPVSELIAIDNPLGGIADGNFGHDLAAADGNNDGRVDLFVSAIGNPASGIAGGGQIYYYTSPVTAGTGLAIEDPSPNVGDGQRYGMSIDARDQNMDGNAELAVGAPRKDFSGVDDAGMGFLFYGASYVPAQADLFTHPTPKEDDILGFRVRIADVLGTPLPDFVAITLADQTIMNPNDKAMLVWDGQDFTRPPLIIPAPMNANRFAQGVARGDIFPNLGREEIILGDNKFDLPGGNKTGRVMISIWFL